MLPAPLLFSPMFPDCYLQYSSINKSSIYFPISAPCAMKNCEHLCVAESSSTAQCACRDGYNLQPDLRTCKGESMRGRSASWGGGGVSATSAWQGIKIWTCLCIKPFGPNSIECVNKYQKPYYSVVVSCYETERLQAWLLHFRHKSGGFIWDKMFKHLILPKPGVKGAL